MTKKHTIEQGRSVSEQEKNIESLIGKTFDNVQFNVRDKKRKGKKIGEEFFIDGTDDHKIMFLHPNWLYKIEQGQNYNVEVLNDTQPGKRKGKLFVKIIAEDGVPIESEQRRETPLPIEVNKNEGSVLVLEAEISYNQEGGPLVPDIKKFDHFTLDEHTLKILHKVAGAVEQDLPLLLEGDTAATKTSAIEYLAAVTNHEVIRLNLSGQTDTSELIGKFVPNDGQVQLEFEKLIQNLDHLKPLSRDIVEKTSQEGRELTKMESQIIAKEAGLQVAEWRWQDGAVPQAMKNGSWLILDEFTFADPSVRERLNSVLERGRSLVLSENGGVKIGPGGDHEIDKRFKIFATTNPADFGGRIPLTPAEARRWSRYMYVNSPPKESYIAMMNFMAYGEQPKVTIKGQEYKTDDVTPIYKKLRRIPRFREMIQMLASFHFGVEKLAKDKTIGKNRKRPYVFTRDNLINLLEFLEKKTILDRKTRKREDAQQNPNKLLNRALEETYFDFIVDDDDRQKVKDVFNATFLINR